MRKALTMLVLALVLPAGAALADDDCRVPMADWQPREAVTALAQERGWTISGIKIDPGNLDLVEMRIRYRDRDGRRTGSPEGDHD